ncbi:P-loop containing nucleoside triphosphate hydrolase protein [Hypoxylon trugodes]|uniref:P-loop containing nucleoside triphosphate hydrolase protein n=1 Tax=Hypoxylon trugodes TaxID=326681 RepID=UPI00219E937F|nr:P-loop containing nucleoside triphosphate hydrolase protein [Hypoxylon trugodes]KAI1385786.1 P-loop containing nucleoside triphosphate hydrolase protein [Hypoxylon trugodes]
MAGTPTAMPLQSKDHKTLMDTIDKLRSKGINRYVNLPQIVVCGDQSSGKSSVLQAISGMSFPTQDNLCTRFATELILRHTNENVEKCHVSISPGIDRSAEERAKLEQFQYYEIPDNYNIGALVDKAKEAMGVDIDQGGTFCKDVLRIELSGPTQPHLTIVDLPGLFRAGNKDQSVEDAAIVQSLVLEYMRNPRSIILAVVSAQSNFALQEVTQHAREIDIGGVRTLGLVTKPDTLDVGSASEREYFDLVQNRDVVKFRLGWHVMRNRGFKTRNSTNEERDKAEAEFLNQGVWAGLPRSQKGSATLRTRLSEVLKDQILDQLPEVLEEIQKGIDECSSNLEKLGTTRSTLPEQRKYLLNASHQFSNLITEAKDGFYQDRFFGNARDDDGYQKRLRSVVQNTLTDFSHEMRTNGQARRIAEDTSRTGKTEVSRNDYLEEVKNLMNRTRGCELPGTYNPLIIGELFHEQCTPWRGWLEQFSGRIFDAVDFVVNEALSYVLDEDTKTKLWGDFVNDALEKLHRQLQDKIDEILRPHEDGHPITYNHYLTENVQKARINRFRNSIMRGLKESGLGSSIYSKDLDHYLDSIMKHTESDMQTLSCSDAVDWMEAYYKVALKQVVDDFSKLAIEACLISKLPGLFTPELVFELSDDAIGRIAAESWEMADERKFLTEKLEILSSGMAELQRLSKHRQHINVNRPEDRIIRRVEPVGPIYSDQDGYSRSERSSSPSVSVASAPHSIVEEIPSEHETEVTRGVPVAGITNAKPSWRDREASIASRALFKGSVPQAYEPPIGVSAGPPVESRVDDMFEVFSSTPTRNSKKKKKRRSPGELIPAHVEELTI